MRVGWEGASCLIIRLVPSRDLVLVNSAVPLHSAAGVEDQLAAILALGKHRNTFRTVDDTRASYYSD